MINDYIKIILPTTLSFSVIPAYSDTQPTKQLFHLITPPIMLSHPTQRAFRILKVEPLMKSPPVLYQDLTSTFIAHDYAKERITGTVMSDLNPIPPPLHLSTSDTSRSIGCGGTTKPSSRRRMQYCSWETNSDLKQ